MSEKNKYDFLIGNRTIFYVLLPIMFLVLGIFTNDWGSFEYIGFFVSASASLLVLEGLNWAVKKFNMWLDVRRGIRKADMRKI